MPEESEHPGTYLGYAEAELQLLKMMTGIGPKATNWSVAVRRTRRC